jgi:hypothetical protein
MPAGSTRATPCSAPSCGPACRRTGGRCDAGDGRSREGDAALCLGPPCLCRQGLRLRIGGTLGADRGPSDTVWLQLRHQPRSAVEAPMLVLEVLAGVRCVLVETHDREPVACQQPVVQNLQAHIVLGEGATLQHLRIATPGAQTASRTTCTPGSAVRTTHRRWSPRAAATTCSAT